MIANTRDGWLIATPPRCGTHTLESLARRHGWEVVRPGRHRMTVPPRLRHLRRRMMIRDPYDHLESVWRYLGRRSPGSDWGWRQAVSMDFPTFINWLANMRAQRLRSTQRAGDRLDPSTAPDMWIVSFTDCLRILERDVAVIKALDARTFEVEAIDVHELADALGVEKVPHNNASKRERPLWTPAATHVANQLWCAEDCKTFGYTLRDA